MNASAASAALLHQRYAVVRRIGSGTQATVYLVRERESAGWLALKVACPELDDARRWRFVREARLMKRLAPHPHVLSIHDVLNVAGTPAIVTELAEGGSVAAWIGRNGALPPRLALEVAVQCASALEHAHAAGVLHRDVKPGNMLIQADGRVVLADFGVARCARDGDDDDRSTVGTPAFMAPEQLDPRIAVDGRADVYALGAAIHRLCTGRREVALFRVGSRPDLLAGIDEPIAAIVRRCCRYEREERIGTVTELLDLLLAALEQAPPAPAGTPPLYDRPFVLPDGSEADPEADVHVEELRARVTAWGQAQDEQRSREEMDGLRIVSLGTLDPVDTLRVGSGRARADRRPAAPAWAAWAVPAVVGVLLAGLVAAAGLVGVIGWP